MVMGWGLCVDYLRPTRDRRCLVVTHDERTSAAASLKKSLCSTNGDEIRVGGVVNGKSVHLDLESGSTSRAHRTRR